jgi:PAS domain S-box-containing protein
MKEKDSPVLEKERILNSFLSAFSNIVINIIKKKDLDFILKKILVNTAKFLGTRHGCIFLSNPTQEYFNIRFGIGDFKHMIGFKCSDEMSLTQRVLETSKTVIVNDHCEWDNKKQEIFHQKTGKTIGIPIKTEEKILGIFVISFHNLERKFNEDELKYINAFSSLALIALDNARLFNYINDEYNELLRIEKSLRQSEDKFSKLFNLSPTLMSIISLNDKVLVDINESMLNVLKFKKFEIIGKKIENFVSLKPEVKKQIISLVENRQIVKNIDVHILTSEGDERSGLLSNQIINLNDEDCMVFIVNDVTEINLLKEELEKSKNLEALGILSGGIAHNFNNLMQSLLGNISLAKYVLKPEDQVYKILSKAEKSYAKTRDLTDQLLTFADGGFFYKNIITVRQLLKKVFDELKLPDSIIINLDINENIKDFEGDEQQLIRCFKNILQNCIEAINDKGTIEIKIHPKNIKISEGTSVSTKCYFEFVIKDTGSGMKKEDIRKVFTPFFTTKNMEHKGLGLAISNSIINRHNGKIKIDSQPGIGTTVKILLPEKL